jgi:hypothetical protein
MSKIQFPRLIASCLLLVGVAAHASVAGAASHCKGMAESACSSDSQCTWVDGYQRKDGRKVSSHCKLKRGKPSAQVSQSSKMASSATK